MYTPNMTECDVSAGRQESQDDASRLELLLEALVRGQLGAAIVEAAQLATMEHLGQEAL